MQLDCGLATIRPWQKGDEDSLVLHANDRAISMNLRDAFPHPYTRKDAEEWIQHAGMQTPPMHFAICVDKIAVGGVGMNVGRDVERCSAEIGYWLGQVYWGRGITAAVVRAFSLYAIPQFHLSRLFAVPFADNPASARVLEKAGYRLEGRMRRSAIKDGIIRDQLLYAFTDEDALPVYRINS